MTFRSALPALALAFALTACDAADDAPSTADATADTEAAAVSIAAAVALDGGGVLDEMATSALASVPATSFDGSGPGDGRPGCERTRTYDEATMRWTITAECVRSTRTGRVSAAFSRVSTVQFLLGGVPQQAPEGADALAYDILSGASVVRTPRHVHRVTSLAADFDVTELTPDSVTVNGTYARSGADSLQVRRASRAQVYTLTLEATDVRGPRRVYERWRSAVSGTLAGRYVATVTRTLPNGTTDTREIDRTFTVTFPAGGEDAEIALDGRRFRADRSTGEIASLE